MSYPRFLRGDGKSGNPSTLHGGDFRLSAFRIHILRLSDGFPHPLAALVDPAILYVDYESKKTLSSLNILVSGHRLVTIAAFDGAFYFGRYNTLTVWDWRSGQRVLVSSLLHSTPKNY